MFKVALVNDSIIITDLVKNIERGYPPNKIRYIIDGNNLFTISAIDNGTWLYFSGPISSFLDEDGIPFPTNQDLVDLLTSAFNNGGGSGEGTAIKFTNTTDEILLKGTPVKYTVDDDGNLTLALATASNDHLPDGSNANEIFGIVEKDTEPGDKGKIITNGLLKKIDLSAFENGDILYLTETGTLSNVVPTPPIEKIEIGIVLDNSTEGELFVNLKPAVHLNDIAGFNIGELTNDDIFYYDEATNTVKNKQPRKYYASGSILAATACVNNVVNIPNRATVKTVGTTGNFPDLQTAINTVATDTELQLVSDITLTETLLVNKSGITINLDSFTIESSTTLNSMINISVGDIVIKNGTLRHSNDVITSADSVIGIITPINVLPIYIYNNTIEASYFGIAARGQFYIGENHFKYIGANQDATKVFIRLHGSAIESRIYNNTFEGASLNSNVNFISANSISNFNYTGKLFVTGNKQTTGAIYTFFTHTTSNSVNNLELYVANNEFDEISKGISINVLIYNFYKKIGIYNNTQGNTFRSSYKGLFIVEYAGVNGELINDSVILEWGDNIIPSTTLDAAYSSFDKEGSNEIVKRNLLTFTNLKEKVEIENSLNEVGIVIQDLKSRKTFIKGVSGTGTQNDPYIVIAPKSIKIFSTASTDSSTYPTVDIIEGSSMYVTEDGTLDGIVIEEYRFVNNEWKEIKNTPKWSSSQW